MNFSDGPNEEILVDGQAFQNLQAVPPQFISIGGTDFQISFAGDILVIEEANGGEIPGANLELLIESIEYRNNSSSPIAGDRILEFRIVDLDDEVSEIARSRIAVEASLAPVAVNDQYTIGEDSTLDVDVVSNGILRNDTNANSSAIATLLTDTTDGTLTLNDDGTFEYVPDPDFFGTDSFTYQLDSNGETSAPGTVTITVFPVNDAPVINLDADDSFEAGLNHSLTYVASDGLVSVTDSDVKITDIDNSQFNLIEIELVDFKDGDREEVHLGGVVFSRTVSTTQNIRIGSTDFVIFFDGARFTAHNEISGAIPVPAADLELLASSLEYQNISADPTLGDRLIQFRVQDEFGQFSEIATSTISIQSSVQISGSVVEQDFVDDGIGSISFLPGAGFDDAIVKLYRDDGDGVIGAGDVLIDVQETIGGNYSFDNLSENSSCLLYTSPSPRDATLSRMPSSA